MREEGKGVRLAQKTQVGPRIPVGRQLEKAEGGPSSGPTRRLSHFGRDDDQQCHGVREVGEAADDAAVARAERGAGPGVIS